MWHDVKKEPPTEGEAVVVLPDNPQIAYFCEDDFFVLKYDPHLGIMRKSHLDSEVKSWSKWIAAD